MYSATEKRTRVDKACKPVHMAGIVQVLMACNMAVGMGMVSNFLTCHMWQLEK